MEEEKLHEMYALTKENNKMLHTMRRHAIIGGIIKFIFWFIVLVGIPYFSWLYIQPYVDEIQSTYQSVHDQSQAFSSSSIAKFFEQFTSTTTAK